MVTRCRPHPCPQREQAVPTHEPCTVSATRKGADYTVPSRIDIIAIIDYDEIMQTGESPIPMSSITIRNLDPAIKERLRVRAAEHGHSMEAEARRILQSALKGHARKPTRGLYDRIHDRFA